MRRAASLILAVGLCLALASLAAGCGSGVTGEYETARGERLTLGTGNLYRWDFVYEGEEMKIVGNYQVSGDTVTFTSDSFLPAESMKIEEGQLVDTETGQVWVKI